MMCLFMVGYLKRVYLAGVLDSDIGFVTIVSFCGTRSTRFLFLLDLPLDSMVPEPLSSLGHASRLLYE